MRFSPPGTPANKTLAQIFRRRGLLDKQINLSYFVDWQHRVKVLAGEFVLDPIQDLDSLSVCIFDRVIGIVHTVYIKHVQFIATKFF